MVLVHGAFVDASGWQAVYDILTKDGFEVLIVQNPTISLDGDVAATERAIAKAKHPVILVGHSYGGMVITEAGNNPKVRSLAYIAAYAPDAGESVETLATQPTPPEEPKAPLLPPQDGYLIVDPVKFPTAFAADVDPITTHFMAAAQVPWGLQAVQTKITKVAWKTKPAHYMVTHEGRHDSTDRSAHDGEADRREGGRDREQPRRDAVASAGGGGLHQRSGRSHEIAVPGVPRCRRILAQTMRSGAVTRRGQASLFRRRLRDGLLRAGWHEVARQERAGRRDEHGDRSRTVSGMSYFRVEENNTIVEIAEPTTDPPVAASVF